MRLESEPERHVMYHITPTRYIGGFMAKGAENQLRMVMIPGVRTLGDGSVGRWDRRERFFLVGFNVGGHL